MKKKLPLYIIFFLSLYLLSGCASTSEDQDMDISGLMPPPSQNVPSQFYLAAGDGIEITVWRNDEFNQKVRINPDGRFFYPTIGNVQAKGKTIEELRSTLIKGLSDKIVDPQVNIEIVSSTNRKVFVLGEVRNPGVFRMEGPMNILEAISSAGGMTLDSKLSSIMLIRGGFDNPEVRLVDVKSALKGERLDQIVSLAKGDIIFVPRSVIADVEKFFRRLSNIFGPLLDIERGIIMGDFVKDVIEGGDDIDRNVNINIFQ